ncbi:hypothetical protein CRUP_025247 [Coryphaenoides rupestris]|nr:hypothetical protein CRUP_025247 [Coryphaenoides rupestris]
MPRKKVTDVSGNGGAVKKKRAGAGKRKEREFSSDDEFDFEQENTKKPGRPAAKAGLQPVTVADDVKEKIVTAYRNLGQNLWGPHRYGCLNDVQVVTRRGQLGHGDTKASGAPKLIETLADAVIVSAACGRNHTLALTDEGTAYSFGENKLGQLGQGNQTDAVLSPAPISYNGQPLVKVACGAEFSMAVDCKGNLYSFGCPEYGQLGKTIRCNV